MREVTILSAKRSTVLGNRIAVAERAQEQEANRRRQICCMSRCHCKLHLVAITIGLCVQGNNGQKYLSRSSRFNLVNVSCLDTRAASGERTQIFTDLVEKLVRSLLISEKGTIYTRTCYEEVDSLFSLEE